jgi:S-adenosylmethionine hydrolase
MAGSWSVLTTVCCRRRCCFPGLTPSRSRSRRTPRRRSTAAALATGAGIDSLGDVYANPEIRRTPEVVREADGWLRGEVIVIDRFGNAVTNLLGVHGGEVHLDGRAVPLRRTYADVASGEPVALVGSSGLIEVAVRDGSAAKVLGIARGASVRVRGA